jgi:pentatricopeptide repeat protein
MLILYNSNPTKLQRIKPDFLTFNIAISSLSNDDSIYRHRVYGGGGGGRTQLPLGGGVGKACYDHIMSMLELYYKDGTNVDVRCAPDIITFSTVLNVLGRSGVREKNIGSGHQDVDDVVDGDEKRAREILDIMLYLSGISDDRGNAISAGGKHDDGKFAKFAYPHGTKYEFDVRPRNKHFNVVLALMANKRRVTDETLDHAMKYVNIMELLGRDEMMDGGLASDDLPQRHSDNVYIDGDDDSAYYDNHRHVDPRWNVVSMTMMRSAPDIVTYNTLLNIAARAGRPEKAEELLNSMINGTSSNGVRPDNISFNTVLLAWSKAKSDRGRLKTEQILDKMHKCAMEGDANVRPDRTSMTTVINAIISTVQRNRMAPIQAERIIELMESNKDESLRPDVVTYTSLIKCWSESGKLRAPDRAEEIINTLHERYDMGYNECKPDTMVYNVAMNAIAKSGVNNAPERAEALLNRMLDRYYAGDTDLTPTTQSFSTTILAWARMNDRRGAIKAEELLQTMHDLEDAGVGNVSPNTICYSTCILAWKNSGQPDAGEHANAILEKMESFENKGLINLKPNVVAFTNAMEAWITSQRPESLDMVEAILERMVNRAISGDLDSAPTTTSFNVALKAIRHSAYPGKHEKANEMLNRMKWMQENGVGRVRPNIYTYNAVSKNSSFIWSSAPCIIVYLLDFLHPFLVFLRLCHD